MMHRGAEAIALLERDHPTAHIWFGDHKSFEHFALMLEQPQWTVLEDSGCWTFYEDVGDGVLDFHWFCPDGANPAPVRRMIRYVLDANPGHVLTGTVPEKSSQFRKSLAFARAIGAKRVGRHFILTLHRLVAYSPTKPRAQE